MPLRSCKNLVGKPVENSENEELGRIEDIMIDAEDGRVAYAILSFGGFLGVGNKLFAIPMELLHFDDETQQFTLNLDREVLVKAPGFARDHLPGTSPQDPDEIYRYYGEKPFWEEGGLH